MKKKRAVKKQESRLIQRALIGYVVLMRNNVTDWIPAARAQELSPSGDDVLFIGFPGFTLFSTLNEAERMTRESERFHLGAGHFPTDYRIEPVYVTEARDA